MLVRFVVLFLQQNTHCRSPYLDGSSYGKASVLLGYFLVRPSHCEASVRFVLRYYAILQVLQTKKALMLRRGQIVGTKKAHVRQGQLIRFVDYRCCQLDRVLSDSYFSERSARAPMKFVVCVLRRHFR